MYVELFGILWVSLFPACFCCGCRFIKAAKVAKLSRTTATNTKRKKLYKNFYWISRVASATFCS